MARRIKRRKANPLPILKTRKEDALQVIATICQNAGVAEDQSVVGPELDPEGVYTPINLVAHSVDPRVAQQMLKLLLGDDAPFYRGIVDELEEQGLPAYESGRIPEEWLEERTRRDKTHTLLEDKYRLWALDYEGPMPGYEDFRSRLGYETRKRRKRRH